MAEFARKIRYYRYKDKYCKKYLREDFEHKCAYCHTLDGDIGGSSVFEKDHFVPKNRTDIIIDKDQYQNLYYSCKQCNGVNGKTGDWTETLLDPCKDDIYGVHIKLKANYVFQGLTKRGEEFINLIGLNTMTKIKLRQKIAESRMELLKKIEEYQNKLSYLDKTNPIASLLYDLIKSDKTRIHKGLQYADYLEDDEQEDYQIYECLKKYLKVQRVFDDYDIDYIYEDNNSVLFHLEIVDKLLFNKNGVAKRYISSDNAKGWIGLKNKLYIIYYAKKENKFYFSKFTVDRTKDIENKNYLIKIHKENDISRIVL